MISGNSYGIVVIDLPRQADPTQMVGGQTRILGNLIGLDLTGLKKIANGTGMLIAGSNNYVGSANEGGRNIISGNSDSGVKLAGSGSGNRVQSNYIGTDINGTTALSNGTGVLLADETTGNLIGGRLADQGNVISGNNGNGIEFYSGTKNTVRGNYIGTDRTGMEPLRKWRRWR